MSQSTSQLIRPAHFADNLWYSADPNELAQTVQSYLGEAAPLPDDGQILGIVAPHAGYRFSGHVAGTAFTPLANANVDTVILLGPDHRGAAPGRISTPVAQAWQTPLGQIPVAWDLLDILNSEFKLAILDTDKEHALEIELPFLQKTLASFRLLPLMMGDQSRQMSQRLSASLAELCHSSRISPLFVASSDLSHYLNDTSARLVDRETIDFIINLDGRGLLKHVATARMYNRALACGAGAIATVIFAVRALGATKGHLLKYATSANTNNDPDRVVGYAAIAFTRPHR